MLAYLEMVEGWVFAPNIPPLIKVRIKCSEKLLNGSPIAKGENSHALTIDYFFTLGIFIHTCAF